MKSKEAKADWLRALVAATTEIVICDMVDAMKSARLAKSTKDGRACGDPRRWPKYLDPQTTRLAGLLTEDIEGGLGVLAEEASHRFIKSEALRRTPPPVIYASPGALPATNATAGRTGP